MAVVTDNFWPPPPQHEVDSDEEVMETEKSLVAHVPVPSQEQVGVLYI